jgi:YegS/Rv2252/BmrU family lipid kinase
LDKIPKIVYYVRMHNDSYRIILNPKAGKGKALGKMDEIQSRFAASGVKYEIVLTERVGHATLLAAEAGAAGWTVVVAAGGDGTVNEVVNGLMGYESLGKEPPALAVLAVGRGNDFSAGADVPADLESGLDCIFADNRRPMDVGRVVGGDYPQGRYFCNGMGIGFDTIVGLEAAKMKRVHGAMAYVLGAVRTFIKYPKPPLVTVRYDGGEITCLSNQINVMNGRRLGGVFWMAPEGKNYDGLLDLGMLRDRLRRGQLFRMLIRYTKGTQLKHPLMLSARTVRLSVEALDGGLTAHADGETICVDGKQLEIELLPSRVELVCGLGAI